MHRIDFRNYTASEVKSAEFEKENLDLEGKSQKST